MYVFLLVRRSQLSRQDVQEAQKEFYDHYHQNSHEKTLTAYRTSPCLPLKKTCPFSTQFAQKM